MWAAAATPATPDRMYMYRMRAAVHKCNGKKACAALKWQQREHPSSGGSSSSSSSGGSGCQSSGGGSARQQCYSGPAVRKRSVCMALRWRRR